MANFAQDVKDATLAKLVDAVANSIRQPGGSILTSFIDRTGAAIASNVPADKAGNAGYGREFELMIRINPDGTSAVAKVMCLGPMGTQAIGGAVDLAVLATKLV